MSANESIRRGFDPNEAIDWRNFNQKISRHFTVGEALNRDYRRVPPTEDVEKNILDLAAELDLLRLAWGKPVGVTSWYRPASINRAVGGVDNSSHIQGIAADIYSMDGDDSAFEAFVLANWGGAVGRGVRAGRGFTHVDLRGGGWKRGAGSIRWDY